MIGTASIYGDFVSFGRFYQKKTKPISDNMTVLGTEGLRLPQSRRSFAMTLVGCLKKQTQFDDEQIGVNSYLKGRYEETHILRAAKTKPIQACPEQRRMEPISEEPTAD